MKNMNDLSIFQAALGLGKEWLVTKTEFDAENKRLDIYLDFEAMIMTLVDQMPVKNIADMMEVEDTRLWRIIEYYVNGDLKPNRFFRGAPYLLVQDSILVHSHHHPISSQLLYFQSGTPFNKSMAMTIPKPC